MGRIGSVINTVSGLGPWKWAVYGVGGAVVLVGALWAAGVYGTYVEHGLRVEMAKKIEGASADTLEADLKRLAEEKAESEREIAVERERSQEREARAVAMLEEARKASVEAARASLASRREHERRRAEIPASVAQIADSDVAAQFREELRLHRVMDGTEPRWTPLRLK